MLHWKKLGSIFDPTISRPRPWMQAYAQCPCPLMLDDRTLRVYITSRGEPDAAGQYVSYPGFVDLASDDLTNVRRIAERPLMSLGDPGTFDEFGITPTSFVRRGAEIYAYYTGWSRTRSVPYSMAIGVAISTDGGESFARIGRGPILTTTPAEPFFTSGAVVREIDGRWHMWYITGLTWLPAGESYEAVYQLVHAQSTDGIAWERDGRPIIAAKTSNECQVSFALFARGSRWHTVFAYRQPTDFRTSSEHSYRLGHAFSDDLRNWTRDDESIGIDVSERGWDSSMMCYPQIGQVAERTVLFYCGNGFGRNGFGAAELVE